MVCRLVAPLVVPVCRASQGMLWVVVSSVVPMVRVPAPSLSLFPAREEAQPQLYVSWHWFGIPLAPWRAVP